MNAIEFDVNVVDTVIAWQKAHRVDISVDGRNETIVFTSRWRNHLFIVIVIVVKLNVRRE